MTTADLPFRDFDALVSFVVLYGFWRGWKNGLPNELLPLGQWVAIIGGGAITAEPLGNWLGSVTGLAPPLANVCAYLGVASVLKLLFLAFGRFTSEQPFSGGLLGKIEKGVGVVSGGLRYGASILLPVAVLNAFDTQNAREGGEGKSASDGGDGVWCREGVRQPTMRRRMRGSP